jgi:hypothetical protein
MISIHLMPTQRELHHWMDGWVTKIFIFIHYLMEQDHCPILSSKESKISLAQKMGELFGIQQHVNKRKKQKKASMLFKTIKPNK